CWHSVSSNKGAKPYQRLPSHFKLPRIPGSCPRFRNRVHDSGMLTTIPRNPEKWTSSRRNQWTPSIGMGGQHRLEWLVKMARNTQSRIPIVTREHVRMALAAIDRDGVPRHRGPTDYVLVANRTTYPPKYVLAHAVKCA